MLWYFEDDGDDLQIKSLTQPAKVRSVEGRP